VRNIILLGLTSLLTDISSEMVYPLIPFFLASLGAGPAALGLIEGLAETTASLLKVVSGRWSDRAGRRKGLTVAGYGSSAVGKLLLAIPFGWPGVLVARTVDRIGKGIRSAPRDALIAESAIEGTRGRAFGLHRGMDTAGAVIGTGIALAVILGGGAQYVRIFLLSVIPAAAGVALLFLVKEAAPRARGATGRPPLRWGSLPADLRVFLGIALLFTLGNSSNTFLLLRASGAGVSTAGVLLLYLVYNVSYMLWSYPAGRLSDRLGRKNVLVCGYALYGLVYCGFAALGEGGAGWLVWVLFIMYGAYSGLTDGVEKALVADLAPRDARGTAIGLHAAITGAGLLPASILAGFLWDQAGAAAPFLLGGTMGLAAAALVALLVREGTSARPAAL